MRTPYIRTMLAGFAMIAIATGAAAQDRSALLTSIEVKELATSSRPADQLRLRDHFAALADKYTTDARRYRAVAYTLTGNPNHPPAVPPGARWTRAAKQAEGSAAVARELAAHHGRLAARRPSQVPPDTQRFEAGEGAPTPTDAQLRELSAGARTPTDHRALEEYFSEVAQKYTSAAQEHAAMAQRYRLHPNDRAGSFTALAAHCERLAKQSRESADTARAMAAEHRQPTTVG